jgi:hypothetical protein
MGPYKVLTTVLVLLSAYLRAYLARSGLHSHSSKWLSHSLGQMVGCSGLETEMDFGEVQIQR